MRFPIYSLTPPWRYRAVCALCCLALPGAPQLLAQPGGPSPVRYTEAREHTFRALVELPGTVEPQKVSTIAGEVEGLVVEFPVREGDTLKKGHLLAQLRTENLRLSREAAEAQLKEAEARLKLAERNLERSRELFESEVFSREELDESLYGFSAQEGVIDRLKAEIARINDDIERCTIVAPFDGVILAERTQVGQWLGKGDPVVELMSADNLEITVDVPERYFQRLKVGSRVNIEFEALGGRKVAGTVQAVIPRADSQARTFPLKLRFPPLDGQVAAGMLAQVSFSGGQLHRATVVPKDAVVSQGSQRLVFVVGDDNTVNPVPVQVGAGIGPWYEVRGPVRPGQKVVTRGNERLFPGQPVEGQPLDYPLP